MLVMPMRARCSRLDLDRQTSESMERVAREADDDMAELLAGHPSARSSTTGPASAATCPTRANRMLTNEHDTGEGLQKGHNIEPDWTAPPNTS